MDRIKEWADRKGYLVAFTKPESMGPARDVVLSMYDSGQIDTGFFESSLRRLKEADLKWDWSPKTVIIVLAPRPAHLLSFDAETGPFEVVAPPTYVGYRAAELAVQAELGKILGEQYHLESPPVPLKSLAVRVGLTKYGRNNIAYTKEFGSYQQLYGFVTDAELTEESTEETSEETAEKTAAKTFAESSGRCVGVWAKSSVGNTQAACDLPLLEECRDCGRCVNVCPTGAIAGDRFLLHAERCLTYLNEFPGEWPDWVPRRAHHAVVGCMKCQAICPANRGKLRVERVVAEGFTFEETQALFEADDASQSASWESAKAKLSRLGLPGYESLVGRNLRAVMEARKCHVD
jgi:epoxyqueuosine reductase